MENLQNDASCPRPEQKIDFKSMHSGEQSMQTRKDEDSAQYYSNVLWQWLTAIKEKMEPEVLPKQEGNEPIQKVPAENQDGAVEEKPPKDEDARGGVKRSLPLEDNTEPIVPSAKKLNLMDKADLLNRPDAIKFIPPKLKAVNLLEREILQYCQKKGAERVVSWRNEANLEEIRYFQVAKKERVAMAKPFREMAKSEIIEESKVWKLCRKLRKRIE